MFLRLLEILSGARRRLLRLRRVFLRKIIPPKILVVRNDGLGDFILTLPVISALREQIPHARIYVLAARNLHGLSALLPEIDGWVTDPGCLLKRHRRGKSTLQLKAEYENLVREVSAYRFDLALFCYAEKYSARLAQDAGIPYRLGPLRRAFFMKFNLWYYIPRRRTAQSEYQLNLKILRALRLDSLFRFPRTVLPQLSEKIETGRYIVMHPYKRSGTALVWPMENFQALARHYAAKRHRVIVIGDRDDAEVLRSYFGAIPNVKIRTDLSLVQTAVLLRCAEHFFGNSSGPLHLAALVRTPHTGFYPQNRTASPRRWRTLPNENTPALSEHLLATDFPVNCVTCRLQKCRYYPCTAHIEAEAAIRSVAAWRKLAYANKSLSAAKPKRRRPVRKRKKA
jgi:ADP-heptose:LPS heptosyltransferase